MRHCGLTVPRVGRIAWRQTTFLYSCLIRKYFGPRCLPVWLDDYLERSIEARFCLNSNFLHFKVRVSHCLLSLQGNEAERVIAISTVLSVAGTVTMKANVNTAIIDDDLVLVPYRFAKGS